MSVAQPVATARPTPAARIGLALAGALAVLQLVSFVPQLASDPSAVFIAITVAGVVCLAAIPLAWRGVLWARNTVVAACVLPALTAVPAFFIPGLEAAAVVGAAVGILLALFAAGLVLHGPGPAHRASGSDRGASS
jgi:hypothetical protein